ncbi:hypothetical protein CR513_44119, partial [Mucuna pruriens]
MIQVLLHLKEDPFHVGKEGESKRKNHSKKFTKWFKDKSQVVCYKCKKHRNFKYECPNLVKEKKKSFFNKKKEDDEEVNNYLMVDTTLKGKEDVKEIIFNYLNHLQITYQELLSNFSTLSIDYKDFKKKFAKFSKEKETLTPMFVKGLKTQFIKYKSIVDSGYDISFNKGECIVKTRDDSLLFFAKR